jgi:signal transduction histidine kinase
VSPEAIAAEAPQRELQQLREEHAVLLELLTLDRTALRNFMAVAARTLIHVRALLARPARESDAYLKKLALLRARYSQLLQRSSALPLPTLARLFKDTLAALADPAAGQNPTGDSLLPALVLIDAGFLTLTTIAARTGIPLLARRPRRRRARLLTPPARTSQTASDVQSQTPQLALALRQLCDRLTVEFGKRVNLSIIGLERVSEEYASAIFDTLSQLLRNAIEHGIETPAVRTAAGKSASGALLVEFRCRHGAQAELVFQDDGQGLDARSIVQAASAAGLIRRETDAAPNPRQASTLIFHAGVTTAADGEGRGHGMRIVRENVQRLNGQIQVATKRGQFTRVRIRLPLEPAEAVSAQA